MVVFAVKSDKWEVLSVCINCNEWLIPNVTYYVCWPLARYDIPTHNNVGIYSSLLSQKMVYFNNMCTDAIIKTKPQTTNSK